jgi:hypothetical protein
MLNPINVKKYCRILTFLVLPVAVAGSQATRSAGDLHAEIQSIYNFQPHTLSAAQITQKSALLDQFWNKAKSQHGDYTAGLRRELADFSNPPFFFFDGSKLLMSLSSDPADRKIILSAITHTDLRDVQFRDYFLLIHSMAAQGEDTTGAAFHILVQPKFQVFIPQHSLTLAQDYCLLYMLFPTDQDFWIPPAIERLHSENDVTAQKSLLLLLWYSQTSDSDKVIGEFSTNPSKPEASKAYAIELARREGSVPVKVREAALATTEESLRRARRERLKAVSDEALYDLDSYTAKIIAKRK